jgi:hypothetical protein
MRIAAIFGAVVLAGTLASTSARADTPFDTAQSLFDEAKDLATAGRWLEACPKLERSLQLEPNMVTVYRLADCYEHVGRTASAWARYVEAASLARAAGASQRYAAAMARVAVLEPNLARVKVNLAKPVADDAVVLNDGRPLARDLWGTNVAVDAGTHEIDVKAPGRLPFHQSFKAVDSATTVVDVPLLEAAPAPPIVAAPPPKPSPERPPPPADTGSTTRTVGALAAATGVIAVGVGIGLGFAAKAKDRDADRACDGSRCNARGKTLSDDARAMGNIGTVVFTSGMVLAATGVVVWIIGRGQSPPPPASATAWAF